MCSEQQKYQSQMSFGKTWLFSKWADYGYISRLTETIFKDGSNRFAAGVKSNLKKKHLEFKTKSHAKFRLMSSVVLIKLP